MHIEEFISPQMPGLNTSLMATLFLEFKQNAAQVTEKVDVYKM